jgi:ribosomal protein S18 acetylase RimI-like enzyme
MEDTDNDKSRAQVTIRQMEIDDVGAVYHLGEELFTSDEFPFLYRTWDPYEVTEYFTSDAEYCLVAEREDKIIGFILATTVEKEGTAWKKYGYLTWIGIDEAFQRTGLGLRLYRKLEEVFMKDGVRMVMADTEAGNKEAIAFFKTLGFSSARQHLWMAKTIKASAKKHGSRRTNRQENSGGNR